MNQTRTRPKIKFKLEKKESFMTQKLFYNKPKSKLRHEVETGHSLTRVVGVSKKTKKPIKPRKPEKK